MASWDDFLKPLVGLAEGAAVISFAGVRGGKAGNWEATTEEELTYPGIWVNDKCWITKDVYYNQEKHTVVREVDGTVFAASGPGHGGMQAYALSGVPDEGLILQKSKTVIVIARYGPSQPGTDIAVQVNLLVHDLTYVDR
jgi:hypothetical protein